MIPTPTEFEPVSRWHPEGPTFWATRPRRAFRALAHGSVGIRFAAQPAPTVTTWTFDRRRYGDRVNITFASPAQAKQFMIRWRILADAIHAISRMDPSFACHGVRIDLGDSIAPDAPADVLAFARLPGSHTRLIPNPDLLRRRSWLPPARAWHRKSDTLYFRGSSTGTADYEANARVSLCRAARTIPRADCRLSRLKQIDRAFAGRLKADGLTGLRHPPAWLNRHRLLVEADGNSSSWDRYMLIGTFGAVPIRFETVWQECWHDLLEDGVNCVVANRHTLPGIVERLRASPDEAHRIALAASRTVAEDLSREALEQRLAAMLATS